MNIVQANVKAVCPETDIDQDARCVSRSSLPSIVLAGQMPRKQSSNIDRRFVSSVPFRKRSDARPTAPPLMGGDSPLAGKKVYHNKETMRSVRDSARAELKRASRSLPRTSRLHRPVREVLGRRGSTGEPVAWQTGGGNLRGDARRRNSLPSRQRVWALRHYW